MPWRPPLSELCGWRAGGDSEKTRNTQQDDIASNNDTARTCTGRVARTVTRQRPVQQEGFVFVRPISIGYVAGSCLLRLVSIWWHACALALWRTMEVASAFEVDVNLRYFAGRSANGSAQASHNIALLLLERHRGDTKVPEAVIVAVLEHVTLALAQLDAGADLSSARIIREGALTKILDMFPSRAALSTMETVRKRVRLARVACSHAPRKRLTAA